MIIHYVIHVDFYNDLQEYSNVFVDKKMINIFNEILNLRKDNLKLLKLDVLIKFLNEGSIQSTTIVTF